MSVIQGKGYGSSHDWQDWGVTGASRASPYKCRACGATFHHHYPSTPDIFEAIAKATFVDGHKIPDQCPGAENKGGRLNHD